MHTFVCIIGLPYSLILVSDHDIMCMYASINVLTKLMYFQQILYVLGVNIHYGYDMVIHRLTRANLLNGPRSSDRQPNLVEDLPCVTTK